MSDHKHGEMDISVQEKTFDGFIKWSIGVACASIFVLFIMAVFNS
ncbi:aa3-type cytochrome c oxidase subunit IV [uncultured Celeribacter sp.]|nr:aa3-type cytochrome c oxidase subunit IV [uncultured Celeribacter sp.]